MQIVFIVDNLQEMSKSVFLEKYFNITSADFFYREREALGLSDMFAGSLLWRMCQ